MMASAALLRSGPAHLDGTTRRPTMTRFGIRLHHLGAAVVIITAIGVGSAQGREDLLVTVGDVTATTAVLWARSEASAELVAELTAPEPAKPLRATFRTGADRDHTGELMVRGLAPATRYRYRLSHGAAAISGHFATAPAEWEARPVAFVWGGDLGGGGQCRRPGTGYPVFHAMARRQPHFFLFIGDTIYADHRCKGPGVVPGAEFKATSLPEFHAKHRYNREDPAVQEFFRQTAVYAIWDDHDVRNNFAAPTEPLAPIGLRAFLDYWPVAPPREEPMRLYRRARWGRLLDVFILDTRQYRSRACQVDDTGKTMLGPRQRRWLVDGLASSDAVWKVVVSSVSLSIPKGWPCSDSWAPRSFLWLRTGYASERDGLLSALRERQVKNLVVLAADVHYVDLLRHRVAPDFIFHEFTAGPLGARRTEPRDLDASLNPERMFARGGLNNFGEVTVDQTGLTIRIFDEHGQVLVTRIINVGH